MRGLWAWGVLALLSLSSTGCYYDQWQNAERSNRILQEEKGRLQQDLADCELLNREKDTTIDSLNKQLASKDQTVALLTAENEGLRRSLAAAEETLKKMADKGLRETTIITQALPKPLHDALQKLAEENPDLLEYDAAKGAVRWKADLLFPLGSDELATSDPKIMAAMKKFADIVNSSAAAGFDVIVVGHTCTTPIVKPETKAKFPTNWHLSAGRSIRIMELLGSDGVAMTRMGIMGYGEYRPIADNTSREGKAKNRRVEIYLVQKGSVSTMGMNIFEVPGLDLAYLSVGASINTGS
ncbi:MAG TPA: OmpA family protein [Phycisphaerae bacterium]|nr:OmpA family protein [Phycisphaerae bacterium]